MKVITSKDFKQTQSAVLKDVQNGQEYQITFHRKPIAKIVPIHKSSDKKPKPGSHEAFLESLKYTVKASGDLYNLSYKELRKRMIEEKYGEDRLQEHNKAFEQQLTNRKKSL